MSRRPLFFNMGDRNLPEASLRGKKPKMKDESLLSQFQVIHDSLQSLGKKLNIFSEDVSKTHHLYKKAVWECYPYFKASNKTFLYHLSQKIKQKYKQERIKRLHGLKMKNRPRYVSDPPQMPPSANSEASLVEASLSAQGPLQLEQVPVLQEPDLGLDQDPQVSIHYDTQDPQVSIHYDTQDPQVSIHYDTHDPQVSVHYDTQANLTSEKIPLGKSCQCSSSSSSSSVQLSEAVPETVEEHQASQPKMMADDNSVKIKSCSSDHDASFSDRTLEDLSSEGNGISKMLTEGPKSSTLNLVKYFSTAYRSSISSPTAISKNFPPNEPGPSSLLLLEAKSSSRSSHHEVKFQKQRKSEADPSDPKQGFCKEPSTWSVDEVMEFMKYKDPKMWDSLADLFRQQEIDGLALLLLTNDIMLNYLGIPLGPVLKLCYYIEKIKEGNYD